jgi:hypothetical protein
MVSQITSALSKGFTHKQIMDFILKKFPQHSDQIKNALAAGFGIEQVLKFLTKGQQQEQSGGTEHEQALTRHLKRREDVNKGALGLAGLAAAPIAKQVVGAALSRALPTSLSGLIPGTQQGSQPSTASSNINQPLQALGLPQLPNLTNQPQTSLENQTSQPPVSQNISQPAQNQQPERISNGLWEALNTGKDKGLEQGDRALLKIAKKMQTTGEIQSEEDFNLLKDLFEKKKAEGKGLPSALKEASLEFDKQKMGKANQPSLPGLEEEGEPKAPKIEKKSIVASPEGVGEVLEIRNGKAIVEVDGKKHQVDESELESEPEDVIQTVQDILKIPEVDRSSIVSLFTYDPDEKKMYIQFHNGETYKYLDVDPEKVHKIANKMGMPVSQGKNIFGAWSPEDKESLGATLIKEIISDPKYAKPKKGQAENPNYVKLETMYDYWKSLRKKPKRKRI